MAAKGEALLPRQGRVAGWTPPFIFPKILPPEASDGKAGRGDHWFTPSLKPREINSFMISLVPP